MPFPWIAAATLAGGIFGYKGTKDQNIASAAQAQQQMAFQERMSNTAIQRRMADLRKSGLNPILAGKHEASSPSGQQAPMHSKAAGAMSSALNAAHVNTAINTARKTGYEADILEAEIPAAKFKDDWQTALYKLWEKWFDPDDLFPASNRLMDTVSSAREIPRYLFDNTSHKKDSRKAFIGMYGRKTKKPPIKQNYQTSIRNKWSNK